MALFEIGQQSIVALQKTTFSEARLRERDDLQRLLRQHIDVISPNTLIIREEFDEWNESRRRIDLLGIHRDENLDASLVVIELKITEDGGHMELQAIRYAAMVRYMKFEEAVAAFARHRDKLGTPTQNPEEDLCKFLGWDDGQRGDFGRSVKIVLASANFSKEITSTVMWLNENGTEIRCVRLTPYKFENRILVDVQQVIPLPEARDLQIQIQQKNLSEREAKESSRDNSNYDVSISGAGYHRLNKRLAMHALCRHLVKSGQTPERITKEFKRPSQRLWLSVPGKVDSGEFTRLASEMKEKTFDARRWFCGEGQLFFSNERTYALTNQWGGDHWRRDIEALRRDFPDSAIKVEAVDP